MLLLERLEVLRELASLPRPKAILVFLDPHLLTPPLKHFELENIQRANSCQSPRDGLNILV